MDQPQVNQEQDVKLQIQGLLKLQTIDDEINKLRSRINTMEEKTHQEQAHVKDKTTDLNKIKSEADKLLKDKRESETSSKQLLEQISKLNGQIFDVKTNEALRALQEEIKQKKADNSALEERIIEMMMAEDELKLEVKKAESALNEAQQLLSQAEQACQKEAEGMQSDIEKLQSQWDEAARLVNRHLLERYTKLRDGRSGKAMAKVETDVCTGCQMSIPPQMFIELKKYRQIHTCSNCARILYTED